MPAIPALDGLSHFHQAHGRHPNPRAAPRHRELVELVTGGRGWVWHEGRWLEVTPGVLIWNVAGEMTIGRSDFDDPYRCLAVQFNVVGAARRSVPRLSQWADIDAVRAFTRESVRLFFDDSFERATLAAHLHATLRFQARLHHHRAGPGGLPEPLQRALQRIDADVSARLTIPLLAAEAGWSVAHLHAACRRHLGESPHQLLLQRRLRMAKERLAASQDPIKKIAVECGFGSAAAFCHRFRSATGQTPIAYRDTHWRLLGHQR